MLQRYLAGVAGGFLSVSVGLVATDSVNGGSMSRDSTGLIDGMRSRGGRSRFPSESMRWPISLRFRADIQPASWPRLHAARRW